MFSHVKINKISYALFVPYFELIRVLFKICEPENIYWEVTKMEETTYLDPVIEEEDIVDLEEDSALIADVNSTCITGCSGPIIKDIF